jgi:hypothetical protein
MSETETVASSTIAVHRGDWAGLTPEMAAMVAPPVSVSAMPVDGPVDGPADGSIDRPVDPWRKAQLARSRGNMPAARHRRPNR